MQRSKGVQAKDIIKTMRSALVDLDREMSGVLRDEVMKEIVTGYANRLAATLCELRGVYGIKKGNP